MSNEGKVDAPAVPQGWKLVPIEPTKEMLDAGLKRKAQARWLDGALVLRARTENLRPAEEIAALQWEAMLAATPAPEPAQEIDKSVADAEIKAMYVESQGSDKGWLGIEGSYFIGGVVAARKQKAALAPAQLTDEERADMACAVAAICTGASSRTVAATAIEWTERALRAKGGKHV